MSLKDYPNLLLEFDYTKNPILPANIKRYSKLKIWWIHIKDEHIHSWQASVSNRINNNTKCPFCSNNGQMKGNQWMTSIIIKNVV
jgi:hypothetical protein